MTTPDVRAVEAAATFRALHTSGEVLRLANAWDVPTARVIAAAGATAIATTSAGIAWSLGVADGETLDRTAAIAHLRAIAAATDLPLTADVESGFAADPEGVAETIRQVIAAGAVGVNLEDATHDGERPLRESADHARRVAAARAGADAVGVPLFINARTDTYLLAVGPEAERLGETLERAASYLAASADGVFVPGVTDLATIAALADGIDAPLNVLVGPGSPSVAELRDVGVARVSLGSSIVRAGYALARRSAEELFNAGTYSNVQDQLPYGEVNALLSR